MPLKDDTVTPLREKQQHQQQYLSALVDSSDKSSKQNPAYTTNELLSKMKHHTQIVDFDKNGETMSRGGDVEFNIRHMLNQEARQQHQQQIRRTPQDIMNVLGRYCQHDSSLCWAFSQLLVEKECEQKHSISCIATKPFERACLYFVGMQSLAFDYRDERF